MQRTPTTDRDKGVRGVHPGLAELDQRLAARYGDLAHFDADVVHRHRGLLRFAVERPDVEPGHYAVPPASAIGWTRLEVRALDDERLAGWRVVYRRGRAGVFELVPRKQVAAAFARIDAAGAELAQARFRVLCERCDARLRSDESRGRRLCDGCWAKARATRAARADHRLAKVQRADARRREIDSYRRRVLAVLAQHPAEDMWRSELAEAVGVEARAVGSTATYRFNLALQELVEAGEIVVELGTGPTSRGACRQRRFRLAAPRDLQVTSGGTP